jgi:hypothetical protein
VWDIGGGVVRKYDGEEDADDVAEEYGDEGTYSLKCCAKEPPLPSDEVHW